MKKIFLFAALAGIVFASCQKEASVAAVQNEGQQEITFSALSKAMTKGVLGSGSSFNPAGAGAWRTINVAGVMKTADGSVVDFLENTPFSYDATESAWKAQGKYYPIGGEGKDFHFLAYSETKDVESTARWYGSSEVEIQVGEESAKNDIVYSAFKGAKNDKANATFKHSQALVTVWIKTKSDDQKITINKIGFKDVKTSGVLNIKLDKTKVGTDDAADATPKWIYNAGCTCHFAEMGNYKLIDCSTITPASGSTDATAIFTIAAGNEYDFESYPESGTSENDGYGVINNTGCVFDRLFPAQNNETQTMVINYTLGDLKNVEVELKVKAPAATVDPTGAVTWAAGKRYVYQITVNVSEILINPSVEDAWNITTITGQYDPDPIP